MNSQNTGSSNRRSRRSYRNRASSTTSQKTTSRPQRKRGLIAKVTDWIKGLGPKSATPKPRADRREPSPSQQGRESSPRPQRPASRKPEPVTVTSPRLYVGNLSYDATESDLFDLFRGVGEVQNAEVVSHRKTQRSKGFGFVQMSTIDEARRAVAELHDKEFLGRKLVVSGAKADSRSGGDSSGDED